MAQSGIQVCKLPRLGIRVFYTAGAEPEAPPSRELACYSHFAIAEHAVERKTLFTQLMLPQGFLANTQFYPALAHNDQVIEQYAAAVDIVFAQMADILRKGSLEKALSGVRGCDFGRLVKQIHCPGAGRTGANKKPPTGGEISL